MFDMAYNLDKTNKKKAGRPSKLGLLDKEQVKKLILKGLSDKEISDFYGITEQTFNNWKIKDPLFFESLKNWKIEADIKVERSLYERASGYTCKEEKIFCFEGSIVRAETYRHYPPDPTSMIFWLKNRQPDKWREKHEVEHSGNIEIAAKSLLEAVEEAETKTVSRLTKVSAN